MTKGAVTSLELRINIKPCRHPPCLIGGILYVNKD